MHMHITSARAQTICGEARHSSILQHVNKKKLRTTSYIVDGNTQQSQIFGSYCQCRRSGGCPQFQRRNPLYEYGTPGGKNTHHWSLSLLGTTARIEDFHSISLTLKWKSSAIAIAGTMNLPTRRLTGNDMSFGGSFNCLILGI